MALTTVLGYKSVILTLVHPYYQSQLRSSDELKRALIGMEVVRPRNRPAPIWIVDDVLDSMRRRPPDRDSLYAVGRHLALLILLFGGRRVHDLTLLHVRSGELIQSASHVVFQPRFGSKTDKGRTRQSSQRFKIHESWGLSVPAVLKQYLALTAPFRQHSDLFLSVRVHHNPASVQVLRSWIKSALALHGVQASAGSTRSAVATADFLAGISLEDILKKGNWSNSSTLHKHYFRPPQL